MMRMESWIAAAVGTVGMVSMIGVLAGCAPKAAERGTSRAPRTRAPSASEIYRVGEARYAAGAYDEAVRLWKHALLELPQTKGYDDLRHKLVLRIAYGQLMAWSVSGHAGHLGDAKQMLDRYLVKHEGLHGDTARARRQRGDIYELLYQVESRLDATSQPEKDEAETTGLVATADGVDAVDTGDDVLDDEGEGDVADAEGGDAADSDDRDRERHRRDGRLREITVKRDRPSVDDPQMRAMLESQFSNPFNGYVLAAPEVVEWFSARALVRAGPGRAAEEDPDGAQRRRARRLGRAVVAKARRELAACFEAVHARNPGTIATPTVQLTVDTSGSVSDAFVTDGNVVDALGELCVADALEATTLDADDAEAATILVPLTLFHQGAVMICESRITSWPAEGLVFPGDCPIDDPAQPFDPADSPDRAMNFY